MKAITLFMLISTLPLLAAAPDEKALNAIAENYAAAWNKHDAKAMTALWADDGDVQTPVGQFAKGKAEIEKLFTTEHTGRLKETKLSVKKQRVRHLENGVALIDADLALNGGKLPDGKAAPEFPHQASFVATNTGKGWKVAAWRAYLIIGAIAPPK